MNPDSQADTETIDIWADEGGLQLVLHRFPSGKIMVGIDAIRGTDRERLAVVTIARFRVGRIVHFLTPEETEAQHQRAVQTVRNLIKEATGPEPAEVVRAKMRDLISKIESGEASSQTGPVTDLSTLTDTELNERLAKAQGIKDSDGQWWCPCGFGYLSCSEGIPICSRCGKEMGPYWEPYTTSLDALKSGPEKMLREAGWKMEIYELRSRPGFEVMEEQGFRLCPKCEGRGFIRTLVDGERDSEPCSYCRMSGRVMEEQR